MFKKTGGPKHTRKVSNPKADFALRFDMITKDEHAACLVGNMSVTSTEILNLNVDFKHCGYSPGERVTIYQGRASKIMIERLLGISNF